MLRHLSPDTKESVITLGVIGLLTGGCGGGGLYWTSNLEAEAVRSEAWPSAPGRIIHSQVREDTDDEGDTTYTPEVRFEYLLDGGTLQGNAIAVAGPMGYSDYEPAWEVINRYPVGREVEVFMDPAKASRAVLEPGLAASAERLGIQRLIFGIFAWIGGICGTLAAVGLWVGPRK